MQLVEACDEILVLEDGQPFVEKQLKGYLGIGIKVKAVWTALFHKTES